MAIERRKRARAIYEAALQRPPAERSAFVTETAGGDEELRREVETLLSSGGKTELHDAGLEAGGEIGPGVEIGYYRIDRLLGRGGMGLVYRAFDTRLNRPVAIKLLSESFLDANARRRFQREAQMASALNHPHILTVHDVGEYAGSQYLVTEYVDGSTLDEWLASEERSSNQIAELLIGVADGVATAHASNILHRDIKPANILVSTTGYAKLADFGLAKPARDSGGRDSSSATYTKVGAIIGTLAYMSPEQVSGRTLDARSDIFSFGVVLHEALAGQRPFVGDTDVDLMHAIAHDAPAALPSDVPDGLRAIVEKATEKDPAERYQSMHELVIDLKRVARRTGVPGPISGGHGQSAPRRPAAAPRRTKTLWARLAGRRALTAVAASMMAFVTAMAAFFALRDDPAAPGRVAASGVASPATASPDAIPNSVAVLPCENLSPNENDKYFAAGTHEAIVSELQKLSALAVINRRSVLRYADSSTPIVDIARELRVQTILQCSVRYDGGSVRITAALIDPSTGVPRWSDQYPGQLHDIFAIQADVATKIAGALRAQLSASDAEELERRPTSSPEAYRLYLEARGIWQQAELNSSERIHVLVDRALELDDQFASAYALKAAAYLSSLTNNVFGDAVTAAEWPAVERRVRDYAKRALDLDPLEPDARDALRQLNIATWNWTAYEQGLERRDEDYLRFQALWVLSWMGNHEQAVRAAERGILLNPNDAAAEYSLGTVYAYAGDFEAAQQRFARAAELSPDDALVRALSAFNLVARGEHDLALRELQLVEKLVGRNRPVIFLAELAYAYSRIDRRADAERLYREIEALGDSADVGVGTWALASLAIGDTAGALRWLEAAADKAREHEPDAGLLSLMNLRMNRLADPLLEQPEFADVLSRIRGT